MASDLDKAFLLERIRYAATYAEREPEESRTHCFIAALCGSFESSHIDIAKAIALGAGMPRLYPDSPEED